MKAKLISPITSFILAIIYIVAGILLLSCSPESITFFINNLLIWVLIFVVILYGLSLFNQNTTMKIKKLVQGATFIGVAIFLKINPYFFQAMMFRIIGIVASIYAVSETITTYLLKKNNEKYIKKMIFTIISYIIALTLIISPLKHEKIMLFMGGIYFMFIGLGVLEDFIKESLKLDRSGKYIKNKVRIKLPKIIASFIPQKILDDINEHFKKDPDFNKNKLEIYKDIKSEDARIEIFLHLSKETAMGFGHIDLSVENKVYSYGCYDDLSHRMGSIISDGVIAKVDDKKKYIDYCINYEKKKLVGFEIYVDDLQLSKINEKLNMLLERCEIWTPNIESKGATSLLQYAPTLFYKVITGKFKTYYTLSSNCVLWANDIVREAGLEILDINGIITPGTYYSNLENLFLQQNTMVVKKNIYATF